MEGDLIFRFSIDIKASRSKVWDALINPEITRQYMFGCVPITDWKEGSSLIWRGFSDGVDYVIGKVVKFEPEKLLSTTTFNPHVDQADIPDNYLIGEYHLSGENGTTTLHIVQGDFASVTNGRSRFEEAEESWDMALQKLRSILEA